jgi:hypothetical protein
VAGGRGFRAVWTEVKTPALVGGYDCDEGGQYFRCANNTFCIAKQLECDGNPNCGLNDNSDEGEHCMSLHFILLLQFLSFLFFYFSLSFFLRIIICTDNVFIYLCTFIPTSFLKITRNYLKDLKQRKKKGKITRMTIDLLHIQHTRALCNLNVSISHTHTLIDHLFFSSFSLLFIFLSLSLSFFLARNSQVEASDINPP